MPKLKLFLKHLQVAGTKEFYSLLRYPTCFPLPLHCFLSPHSSSLAFLLSFLSLLTLFPPLLFLLSPWSLSCSLFPCPVFSPLSVPNSNIFSSPLSPLLIPPSFWKQCYWKRTAFQSFFTLVQTFFNIKYPTGYFLWIQQELQQNKWLTQSLLECQASKNRCGGISGLAQGFPSLQSHTTRQTSTLFTSPCNHCWAKNSLQFPKLFQIYLKLSESVGGEGGGCKHGLAEMTKMNSDSWTYRYKIKHEFGS